MNPHVKKVIITEVPRGAGEENDPFRRVRQVHEFNGDLIAEYDPYNEITSYGKDNEPKKRRP